MHLDTVTGQCAIRFVLAVLVVLFVSDVLVVLIVLNVLVVMVVLIVVFVLVVLCFRHTGPYTRFQNSDIPLSPPWGRLGNAKGLANKFS